MTMILPHPAASSSRPWMLLAVVLVIASLYFGKDVLMPLALAVLLSFLLAPIITLLQSWRFGRIPAVLTVVVLAFALFGALGWVVAGQLFSLADKLPEYQQNLQAKITSVWKPLGKGWEKSSATVRELNEQLSNPPSETSRAGSSKTIMQVEIVESRWSALSLLRNAFGPILKPVGTAGIVIIFVIFILLNREDLRDRLIYLIGPGRLNATTEALDDAARRLSRYLLMQSIINGTQGFAVGIGLFAIGVPNAVLWGLLSALLRFIPYIGPWLAALAPITLSLAVFDGWTQPLLTIGLILVLELVSNNVVEPWLYGASIGVSPFALVVAAVFWTWLWGTAGLMLSAPLTVCLVVMGKYIPQLEFLSTLLGDKPVLEPKAHFYQRLLAMDQQEAGEVLDEYLKGKQLVEACDTILIPALGLAEQDRHRGVLDEKRERFVLDSMKEMIDELGQRTRLAGADAHLKISEDSSRVSHGLSSLAVFCLPAADEADEIGARLFVHLLKGAGIYAECASVAALAGEMMELVERHKSEVVCISALPPAAVRQACYLCKRLRARFPELQIMVGLWDAQGDRQKANERIESAGANKTVTTFAQGLEHLRRLEHSFSSVASTAEDAMSVTL